MKYVLILLSVIFLSATCNNTTTNVQKTADLQSASPIEGNWTMVSYVAFMPGLPELSEGDIIWKIDSKSKSVAVLMKNPKRTENMGLNTGSYDFEIKGDKMIIGERVYLYNIEEDGKLKVDTNTDPDLSKDRPVMKVIRIE